MKLEKQPNIEAVHAELSNQFGNRVTNARAGREGHGGSEAYHPLEPPDLVVFPESTEEVQAIVRVCASHVAPIVPFGAGTSLEGNASSPRGGVCLDMMKMNRVLAINTGDLDVLVQPGITRKQLNSELRYTGLFFPIDPGADASIGGMLLGHPARWRCVMAP